jgi:methyltransferase-like protein 23
VIDGEWKGGWMSVTDNVGAAQDTKIAIGPDDQNRLLRATTGEFPLHEYHLREAGHAWTILHTGAMLTHEDETHFFREWVDHLPYGVALWPASIALAHEVIARADAFRGKRVLELGSGTGLPGIVAASLGAHVVQTDRDELALSICKRNAARNGTTAIVHRLADWSDWSETSRYDWILGSDILYRESLHANLRYIFETNLAPGGRVLLSDPFRDVSLRLLETLDADGWPISLSKWSVGEDSAPRSIALFELALPG